MILSHFLEYPLDWPQEVPRTPASMVRDGMATEYASVIELKRSFRALGVTSYTISTNDRFFARNLSRRKPPPEVPFCEEHGCAVYFTRRLWCRDGLEEREYCMCSDTFVEAADNVMEVSKAVWCLVDLREAVSQQLFDQGIRSFELAVEKSGDIETDADVGPEGDECSADNLDEDVEGSPSPHVPSKHTRWYRVLGFRVYPESIDAAEASYRRLIKQYHPDVGGSAEDASALFDAIKKAREMFDIVDTDSHT